MQRTHFRHIITDDESWFYLEYQHALHWSISRDEVPQRVNPAIGTAKFMLTTIWGVNGLHLLDLMPSQGRFNTQYFVEHVMAPLVQTIFPQGRNRYRPRLNVHLDNCRVYFSKVAEQFSSRISCSMFPTHPILSTWPRRTYGYSGASKLNSLAEASPSPTNFYKMFENFWREFLLRNCRRFSRAGLIE
jgi:hypothetical protein